MLVLSATACDLWAAHPIATGVVLGGAVAAGGIALAVDHHDLAGGALIGASLGVFAISIPIGVIIDNYNESHSRGARKSCP